MKTQIRLSNPAFHSVLSLSLLFCTYFLQAQPAGMVLVPGGIFTMGHYTEQPTDWQPEHRVTIDSFYMDRCEVTNAEYERFCNETGHPLPFFWGSGRFCSGPEYPAYPVTGINLGDAMKYAAWAGKRLPTEAEWEYAARGGLEGKSFPWGEGIDSTRANYGMKFGRSLPVGYFPPNAFGLCDMSGNVWEWTADLYGDRYYAEAPGANPKGPATGRFRVIRGGSWHSGAMCNRVYYRNGLSSSWLDFAVGFRCVQDIRR